MIGSDNKIEADAKKVLAIKDFELLSTPGILGDYKECEFTHIYLIEKSTKKLYHYYAIISYEEFQEPNDKLKEKYLTGKPISINKKYQIGIKQSRISFDCSKNIFELLCTSNLVIDKEFFHISKSLVTLPKTNIPSFEGYGSPLLQKILKPNIFGDNYIIEFFSNQNPFAGSLSDKDFFNLNEEIKSKINIDLDNLNDRIGSFIFQFPITLVNANVSPKADWCNVDFSIKTYPPFNSNDNIINIISANLDDVTTGCNNFEGICKNHNIELGDSHNLELLVINKQNKLIYQHFSGNFIRYINVGGFIRENNSEPRTIKNSDNEEIAINLLSNEPIMTSSNDNYDRRILKRIQHNDVIKESIGFRVFNNQREEALLYIRKLIEQNGRESSEIWLLDPYLLSKDIIDTLYHQPYLGIKLKCITSYRKSRSLSNDYYFEFKKYKSEQKEYFFTHSNNKDVILDYRITHDSKGFDFHDRFLLFIPKNVDGIPTVYSLGTSINSLGKAHHIIQKVPDPKKIVHTFQELWELLDDEEDIIIRLPEDKNYEK
jgi:hypothetical protein